MWRPDWNHYQSKYILPVSLALQFQAAAEFPSRSPYEEHGLCHTENKVESKLNSVIVG